MKSKCPAWGVTQLGVIAPVDQPTRWVSQMVASSKKSGAMRICIDPRPLNKALKREHYPLPTMDDILPALADDKVFSKVDLRNGYWHVVLDEESSLLHSNHQRDGFDGVDYPLEFLSHLKYSRNA